MTTPTLPLEENVWQVALRHCWTIVGAANAISDILNKLNGIPASAVTPVLSTYAPTIVITPARPDDVDAVRALCRLILTRLDTKEEWTHRAASGRWIFVITVDKTFIEINSMIEATEPKPVKL